MNIKVFTLNAFSKITNGGNPAGVVLNSDNLSTKQMSLIAKKVAFSETAFVQKSNKATLKIRFFTPNKEINLCGHATIATFYLLAKKKLLKPGHYTLESKSGILNIEIKKDKAIFMNQNLPKFLNKLEKKEIAKSLNIPEKIIPNDLPIQIVSTGLKDILIPIKSIDALDKIKPNINSISNIAKKHKAIGYHLFTLETKYNSNAYCRNFAPLYGISEESATGTATGALACYLFKYGKILKKQINNLTFEQGYSMKRPSKILANLKIKNNSIIEIKIGGLASNIKEVKINI
ncbi:PhzF family phenazine biosynthesis protein [Patescibacteria group bacterium]|nr:PhzF family phenazine biosynthesis protein [Patescibacteria group bacterium]